MKGVGRGGRGHGRVDLEGAEVGGRRNAGLAAVSAALRGVARRASTAQYLRSLLEEGMFEQIGGGGAQRGVQREALGEEIHEGARMPRGVLQGGCGGRFDEVEEHARKVFRLEGVKALRELEQRHAERPNVYLRVVALHGKDFGREVLERSLHRAAVAHCHARSAHVADLHAPIARQKQVRWLDVAVDHFSLVNVFQRL